MTAFEEYENAKRYYYRVDWNKRLKNELPLFRELIQKYKVKSFLDIGCGPGVHLLELAKEFPAITFVGIDVSEGMLRLADELKQERNIQNVSFLHGELNTLPKEHKFDGVICLGNALGIILSQIKSPISFFEDLSSRINPGGFFFAQMLNIECPRNGLTMPKYVDTEMYEFIFFKKFTPIGERQLNSEFFTLYRKKNASNPNWIVDYQELLLKLPTAAEIESFLKKAHFKRIYFFSNYKKNEFITKKSDNILLLAEK